MPKAITFDEKPRRGRELVAFDAPVERNLFLRMLLHSPKDMVAGAVAFAAVMAVIGNAMLMQTGRHPAPMFGSEVVVTLGAPFVSPLPKPRPADASARSADIKPLDARMLDSKPVDGKPVDGKAAEARGPDTMANVAKSSTAPATAAARPQAAIPPTNAHVTPASARGSDPLGDLILSSRRVAAVQRALADYGYGQLKPTGTVGSETQAAIQKFERERKLPVTGQISDRMVRELATVTGRSID